MSSAIRDAVRRDNDAEHAGAMADEARRHERIMLTFAKGSTNPWGDVACARTRAEVYWVDAFIHMLKALG